ncbi:hypothetical protein NDN08_007223 [Rhodosorus marinus]|uniref:C2H2-type domain-containing protein n=1 Tax=Rhodosorus marinus TaxID=101924 RepID=A0AAV8UJC5_9RHOD|nr:hypothetical protein NDN08_007223 [Rhodosorus marinus]
MVESGSPFSSLCEYLEDNPVATSWTLFGMNKLAMPDAGEWQTLLIDNRTFIPEATRQVLERSEICNLMYTLKEPWLLMTQFGNRDYSLGSGWAFIGGLPEKDGVVNKDFKRLERIHWLSFREGSKMTTLLLNEVEPGILAFAKSQELNERQNRTIWGIVDQNTQRILSSNVSDDHKTCDACHLLGIACEPLTCPNQGMFLAQWNRRMEMHANWDFELLAMEYGEGWLNGTWKVPVGNLEPVTVFNSCHRRGSVFDSALLCVLQEEALTVHPPRSTFRVAKYEQKVVDNFLGLEGHNFWNRETAVHGGELVLGDSSLDDSTPSSAQDGTESCQSWIRSEGLANNGGAVAKGNHRVGSEDADSKASRKFQCDVCGMMFKRSYETKRHRATVHQKRRDYTCAECGKNFTQNGHLNEHVKVYHIGKNVPTCKLCGKKFGNKSKLNRHVATVHENSRTFQCNVCRGMYKEKSYLKQHVISQHGVESWKEAVGS